MKPYLLSHLGKAALAFLLPCIPFFCVGLRAQTIPLKEGWSLQSSAKVEATGDAISTSRYKAEGWYPTQVPTTVVAALVKNKVYADPMFGDNLRKIPGTTYKVGHNFSEEAMPKNSPFATPWWFRKAFTVPTAESGKTIWLNFEGLNYRGDIWLNGKKIADGTSTAGAWRRYEFNVTKMLHKTGENVLAVEVAAPTEKDLAVTFVDWNPMPADKDMGLFRSVYLQASGPVALRAPSVASEVESPANDTARLTVYAEAKNASDKPVEGVLRGRVGGIIVSQKVSLAAGQTKEVVFSPGDYPQLVFAKPELWWPKQMGTPHLYPLQLQFSIAGKVSDTSNTHFGIRQITSSVENGTRLLFKINGKPILIRGGGWAPDIMLREDPKRLSDELDYVQDMGLNTIRLEGRPMPLDFYDETDRRGILVMAGWSCCDFFEQWSKWTDETRTIAKASMQDQMFRLRGHPSLLVWLNGSDHHPTAEQLQTYLAVEKELHWPNPTISSATGHPADGEEATGVRMTGPYHYVAPEYWFEDNAPGLPDHDCASKSCGGGHGFNTETSMGPAVPPIESLRKMLGSDHLWPIDDWWKLHAGGGPFHELEPFTEALNKRYGKAENVEDYAMKSQLMTYEGVRAMYEAYSKNKYGATGVIQWMLNNAWPSNIWHLYDYYLRPGGGYFGAKIAMQPLHPLYAYNDRSISVVNSAYTPAKGLTLQASVYDLNMQKKLSRDIAVDVDADTSKQLFTLPDFPGITPTYFVDLKLHDSAGKIVGSDFYWLSTTPETLDWKESNWYLTPTKTFSDFTALETLPKVALSSAIKTTRQGEWETTHVTIKNPSGHLAFFIRLKLDTHKGGEEILPVRWEDNYFSLLPGESREVTATYHGAAVAPALEVSGYNVQ